MCEARYEKLKLLGEGTFGAAYLVRPRSSRSGELRVVKEIRTAHLAEADKKNALAEAEVLGKMESPFIVRFFESFPSDNGRLYIVMEYADGGDLSLKIRDRKETKRNFSEREVMFTFVQVALALAHIHAKKVLHRDLKPLNIFLTKQGFVKLGDFGIAKVVDSTTLGGQTTIGTPHYLSPEMCNSEKYGTASDLWALGVVTYELVALKTPFSAPSLPAVALKILGADPEPMPRWTPQDLSWIVLGFLKKAPAERPRLEPVLRLPYVQRYVKDLMQFTNDNCVRGQGQVSNELKAAIDTPCEAPEVQNRRLNKERNQASEVGAHLMQGQAGGACRASRYGTMAATGYEGRAAGGAPTLPSAEVQRLRWEATAAANQHDELARNAQKAIGERQRAQRREDAKAKADAEAAKAAELLKAEYFRTRQAAGEAKRRAEAERLGCSDAVSSIPVSSVSTAAPGSGGYSRNSAYDDDELTPAERNKLEVKRKRQAEREQQDAKRQAELEKARRAALEDQRQAKTRLLANYHPEHVSPETTVCDRYSDGLATLEEAYRETEILGTPTGSLKSHKSERRGGRGHARQSATEAADDGLTIRAPLGSAEEGENLHLQALERARKEHVAEMRRLQEKHGQTPMNAGAAGGEYRFLGRDEVKAADDVVIAERQNCGGRQPWHQADYEEQLRAHYDLTTPKVKSGRALKSRRGEGDSVGPPELMAESYYSQASMASKDACRRPSQLPPSERAGKSHPPPGWSDGCGSCGTPIGWLHGHGEEGAMEDVIGGTLVAGLLPRPCPGESNNAMRDALADALCTMEGYGLEHLPPG